MHYSTSHFQLLILWIRIYLLDSKGRNSFEIIIVIYILLLFWDTGITFGINLLQQYFLQGGAVACLANRMSSRSVVTLIRPTRYQLSTLSLLQALPPQK